jgi:hypothetical protein
VHLLSSEATVFKELNSVASARKFMSLEITRAVFLQNE